MVALILTKHMHPSEENVDKACLNYSRDIPVSERNVVHSQPSDQTGISPDKDGEWNDIETTEPSTLDI